MKNFKNLLKFYMNNIVLNILNKKHNLSFCLIFRKIAKYYWNKAQLLKDFNCIEPQFKELCVKNRWFRTFNFFPPVILLLTAIRINDLDIVKYFTERKVFIDDGISLFYSAKNGYFDILKYLIENGADVHASNNVALRWASCKGHLEIVKYLVEKGANIHAEDNYALRYATQKQHLNIVNYLNSLQI